VKKTGEKITSVRIARKPLRTVGRSTTVRALVPAHKISTETVSRQIVKFWFIETEDEIPIRTLLDNAMKSWKLGLILGAKPAGAGLWELTRAKEQTGSILEFSMKPAPNDGLVVAIAASSVKWSLLHPFRGAVSSIEKAITASGGKPWVGDFDELPKARPLRNPKPIPTQPKAELVVPKWNNSPIDEAMRRLLAKFDDATVLKGIEVVVSRQGRLAYVPLSAACQEVCSGAPRP
jgi:hypothetical protein